MARYRTNTHKLSANILTNRIVKESFEYFPLIAVPSQPFLSNELRESRRGEVKAKTKKQTEWKYRIDRSNSIYPLSIFLYYRLKAILSNTSFSSVSPLFLFFFFFFLRGETSGARRDENGELKVVRPSTLRSNFGLYEILVVVKSAHMAKVGALRRATRPLHSHLNSEPLHGREVDGGMEEAWLPAANGCTTARE